MSQEIIRVILVDDIADTRENMKKLLFFEDDIKVVGMAGSGEEGIKLAKQVRPDVVIMDINMPGIDGISAAQILTREVPGIQIIMMSVQGEADYLRRSMLAGAREFLTKPSTAEEIITSIRRVYNLGQHNRPSAAPSAPATAPAPTTATTAPRARGQQRRQSSERKAPRGSQQRVEPSPPPPPPQEGEVIAVFGTKGGVGSSSLAVNLAIAMQEQKPAARVAIVDGNTEFGDLSVLLNLNVNRTIIDLISVEELDSQYVNDVLISHPSGIKVMPGSIPQEADYVTKPQIERVIKVLREEFDYIFFDTRPTFGEPILTILDQADTILLITSADIPSIRNTRLFFEVADHLDYPKDKMQLILNKYDPQGAVSAEAIEKSVKHPIIAELPRDDRLVNSSIQQGIPYVISRSNSPLSMKIITLARSLLGMSQQMEAQVAPTPATAVKKKRRSLLSRLLGR
jgi:pilus assembly protein CpaE